MLFRIPPQKLQEVMLCMHFFHTFWHIVNPNMVSFVVFMLNENGCSSILNKTSLTLIPKTESPTRVTKFHPINLSNVLYEIIFETVA